MCAFAVPVVAKGFPFATAETAHSRTFTTARGYPVADIRSLSHKPLMPHAILGVFAIAVWLAVPTVCAGFLVDGLRKGVVLTCSPEIMPLVS